MLDYSAITRQLCLQQKEEKGLTLESIAAATQLAKSTVTYFFSPQSKTPTLEVAGRIASATEVSLDAIFNITVDGMSRDEIDRIHRENQELKTVYADLLRTSQRESLQAGAQLEENERLADMERQKAASAMKTINGLRTIVYGLLVLCILLSSTILVLLV